MPPSDPLPSDADVRPYIERLGLSGIIDLHVHFMPDRVQQKVWAFFDRVADSGLPPWPITYRHTEEERVETLRALGVSAFTTLNYAHRPGMAQWLNDYSTEFASRHTDAIHSATFYPEPGVDAVVERSIRSGVRIFKVHIQVGDFSPVDPLLTGAWGMVADAGIPIVIHCGNGPHPGAYTGPDPIRELVRRHPNLVLIIAHAGLPDYGTFADLAVRHPNVYLDTTIVGTDYAEQIAPVPHDYRDTLVALGGKVVLGTDFPTIPHTYSHQLEVLRRWELGDAWMRNTLWHTPKRLID